MKVGAGAFSLQVRYEWWGSADFAEDQSSANKDCELNLRVDGWLRSPKKDFRKLKMEWS